MIGGQGSSLTYSGNITKNYGIGQYGSIAALKGASAPADGTIASVSGYYAAGDGGGGQFYYDEDATDDDNGGTIIEPTAGVGRWKRVYSGAVNVKWFGAKGDGATDDTDSINSAIATVEDIYAPNGTYMVSSLVLNTSNIKFIGSGAGLTIIKCNTVGNNFIELTGDGYSFNNITIDVNRKRNTGVVLERYSNDFYFVNCELKNCYDNGNTIIVAGIYIYGDCKNINILHSKFDSFEATPNGTVGDSAGASRAILMQPYSERGDLLSKDIVINNCEFTNILTREDGDAIQLAGGLNSVDDCNIVISYCKFKNCAKRAIKIMAPGVTVENCEIINSYTGVQTDWSDGMYSAISIYTSNVKIINNFIHGTSFNHPVDIAPGGTYYVKNIQIIGNRISVGEGGTVLPDFGSIYCFTTADNIIISDNIIIGGIYGIYFRSSARIVSIAGNIVTGVTKYGIFLDSYQVVEFKGFSIAGNSISSTQYGMVLASGTLLTVVANNIISPSWEGIYGAGSYVKSGNTGNFVDGDFANIVTALPSAVSVGRGNALLKSNGGGDDTLHICIKLANGTYIWKQIALT